MNSQMMQSHAADSSQAAQLYSFTQTRETLIPGTRLVPFVDNFEHLQALELEAMLMVAVATLRRGDRRSRGDEEPLSAIFPFLPEHADLRQAEEMLARIEAENRQREDLCKTQRIDLNFISFCSMWNLDRLERKVVLLLLMQFTSHDFAEVFSSSKLERNCDNGMEIGVILSIISTDLRSQLENRRLFSVHGRLNKQEIIEGHCDHYDERTNILKVSTYLHERHSRYIIGDNNQYTSEFSFIRQERSIVRLEQVIMEEDLKLEVVSTVERFQAAQQSSRQNELDRFFGYGTGLAMLFYGPSGTGKTMLARGLANHLDVPLLTLNMEEVDNAPVHRDGVVSLLFREAALTGGIVLLDECDDIFSGMRNHGMSRSLLLELENSRCITILATNQPLELDPA
ncbi:ATP-binding protein, partial [Geobacter sp. OR-1]|uniref:ATP-binding protein n=1 Tax=Geobacter sp. OR-1 TaxID=1266765 RepID=UPI0005A9C512